MARLGKRNVALPEKVTAELDGPSVTVKGPRGALSARIPDGLTVSCSAAGVSVQNVVAAGQRKLYHRTDALHGMFRSVIRNMAQGVSSGFEKILEIHGTGFKAEVNGKDLVLTLGRTNPDVVGIPDGVSVEVLRNTILFIRGVRKDQVGEFAAKVRAVAPPEPYKGKGIRYRAEYVKTKVGKAAVGVTK